MLMDMHLPMLMTEESQQGTREQQRLARDMGVDTQTMRLWLSEDHAMRHAAPAVREDQPTRQRPRTSFKRSRV